MASGSNKPAIMRRGHLDLLPRLARKSEEEIL